MINFGFDSPLVVSEENEFLAPYPNMFSKDLYGFDIDLYHEKYGAFPVQRDQMTKDDFVFLNSKSIFSNLNTDLYKININTVDYYIDNDLDFLYSILIWNNDIFDKDTTLDIPLKVKNQIKKGKCKFVIFYITEPWFMYQHCYEWLSNFSSKNGFTNENFIFVSSNLIAPEIKNGYINEKIIIDNFKIIEFNYFFHRLWFFKENFHKENSKDIYTKILTENLHNLRTVSKEKHFLCFNRRPHDHRVAIFAELMTNKKLKNKTIATLGNQNMISGHTYKEAIRRFIDSNYKYGYERLYFYIDKLNPNKDYLYDTESMEPEHSTHINLDAHHKTFCNIVTETITSENLIFFSEKIIKPIFALQPFVLVGNRNSLKKLKEYGFKTFDKWWDESYDELKYQSRFEKIIEVLEEISEWDSDKIKRTLVEMEETLIHNFNMLVEDRSTRMFFDKFFHKK